MWALRFWAGARFLVAAAGALAVWAFLVNRVVIQWVDGPFKQTAIGALGFGLALLGALSSMSVAGSRRRHFAFAWVAILGLFGIGEAHRAWLRGKYGATSENASLWHPVTTTDLELRRFTLPVAGLGVSRLRIAHLTDLHVTFGTDPAYVARVHAAVRDAAPDVLVLTGDTLSAIDRLPALERWLGGLSRPRYGSYAVLGNHEHWTGHPDAVRAVLESAGFRLLAGTCETLELPEAPGVRLCGTEEPWGPALDAELASSGVSATLVLSHTPDNVYALAERGATAVFAGHTHGGQMRLPLLGPLIVPSRYGRRFDQGHFLVDGTHLFVSAGVGADAPNLRLFCPPDILIVDLVDRSAE
ncbi:MAG TPA: metallophosphoesterase [Polyangiaceae bacterium]